MCFSTSIVIPVQPAARFLFVVLVLSQTVGVKLFSQANIDESGAELNPIYVDVSNVSGTEDGSSANPWNTIAEAISWLNENPSVAAKVHIADGTYREGDLALNNRTGVAVLEGESRGGVIITGSDIWTDWTQDGSNWYKAWTEDWDIGNSAHPADPEDDLGRRMEMIFQDGVLLRQVISFGELTDGTYFVDDGVADDGNTATDDRIYVRPFGGVAPSAVTLEVSVRTNLFYMLFNDDAVLRNLTFQHAANGRTSGVADKAVFIGGDSNDSGGHLENVLPEDQPYNANPSRDFVENVLIDNCIFRWNNGGGASINNTKYLTIKDSSFIYNGSSGLGAAKIRHSEYIDSEFNFNNWRKALHGGLYGWSPAGTKTLFVDDFDIRGCEFIGNHATGLWMDFGTTNLEVSDSLIIHNASQGFYNEANYGPVDASHLLVRNNGYWPNDGGERSGGVYFAESRDFSVTDSYMINNSYYGLGYRNSGRDAVAYWSGSVFEDVVYHDGISVGMKFHRNTVVASRSENQPSTWTTEDELNGNVIGLSANATNGWDTLSVPSYVGDNNTYYSPHTETVFTDKEDNSFGFDEVDLAGWQSDTGQEANSVWDPNWQDTLIFDAYQESGGEVVFEAEHYHDAVKNDDSEIWQLKYGLKSGNLGDTGSGYMQSPAGSESNTGSAASLSYRIYINTPGTYELALRVIAETSSEDSLHIYLNGSSRGTVDLGTSSAWTWRRSSINLGSLATGLHTLTLIRKDAGLKIDRIAIADTLSKLESDGSTAIGSDSSAFGRPASAPPASPTSFAAIVVSETSVEVYWEDTYDNETSYTLHRSTSSDFSSYVDLGSLPADTTSYTDDGVSSALSTTYYYRLQTITPNGTSSFAEVSSSSAPPAAPSGLTATKQTNDSVLIEWTDNSSDELGFILERSTLPESGFVQIGASLETQTGATSYTDNSIPDLPNTVYYYRVRSTNPAGDSDNSPTDSAGGNGALMPTEGLVFYYAFEETGGATMVSDSSENENDASVIGTANHVDGYIGNALELTDSGLNYLNTNQTFSAIDGEGYTAAVWVNFTAHNPTNDSIIVQHLDGSQTTGRTWLNIKKDGSLFTFTGGDATTTDAGLISEGTWHHIAMSAGQGVVTLYVDGVQVAERADIVESNTAKIQLGNHKESASSRQFNGLMDEARVYDRRLTQSEVELLAGQQANEFPYVDAGADTNVWAAEEVTLAATVTDDGFPDPPATVTYQWDQVSGPGTASFTDSEVEDAVVTFPVAGDYVLRLTASDAWASVSDEVTYTAQSNPTSLTATETGAAEVTLSWPDASDETGYVIQLKRHGDANWTTLESNLAADETSYVISKLIQNQRYEFRVEAQTTPRRLAPEASLFTMPTDGIHIQGTGNQKLVTAEAENYVHSEASSGDTDTWSSTTAHAGSGGTAMELGPDDGNSWSSDVLTDAPRLNFEMQFNQTGTHYIWVRAKRFNTTSDSIHVGINETLPVGGTDIRYISPSNLSWTSTDWTWVSATVVGDRAELDVPSLGIHTVHLFGREDGIVVDQILLTPDVNYTPTAAETESATGETESFTAIEIWRQENYGYGASVGPAADDHDSGGLTNFGRFAFGLGVDEPLSGILPSKNVATHGGEDYLELTYRRREGSGSGSTVDGFVVDGVTYTVELSPTLNAGSWVKGSDNLVEDDVSTNGDNTVSVRVRSADPISAQDRAFIRVRVE